MYGVYGNRCIVCGNRCMICGDRCMMCGNRCMMCGNRCMVCGNRCMVCGNRCMIFYSAKESFDKLKSIYGSGNCYFLPINSINPVLLPNTTVPEPWSGFLRIPSTPLEQVCVKYSSLGIKFVYYLFTF